MTQTNLGRHDCDIEAVDHGRPPRMIILDLIWFGLCYSLGRAIVPLVSFGKLQVEPLNSVEKFNWFGYRRTCDGRLEIDANLACAIGLLIPSLLLAVYLYFVP